MRRVSVAAAAAMVIATAGLVGSSLPAAANAATHTAAAAKPTIKLSQPLFTSYHSDNSDPDFNFWNAAFTFHWTVNDPAGVCSQSVVFADYDTMGSDPPDPILGQDTETVAVAKTARSYATGTDANDFARGGYSQYVRIKDCSGRTITSNPVQVVIAPGEDSDSAVSYSGTWRISHCACASGGTTTETSQKNASVSFATAPPADSSGVDVALVMPKAPNRGSAAVYVDGVKKATVNTFSKTGVNATIVYQISLPGTDRHIVKIVNLATSGHPRIDLDAMVNGG